MFDFSISTLNNKYDLLDSNMEYIKETTIEVKADTTITININDWKLRE